MGWNALEIVRAWDALWWLGGAGDAREESVSFSPEMPQPNGYDCGVYVIKLMETPTEITRGYKHDSHLERIKLVLKVSKPEFNLNAGLVSRNSNVRRMMCVDNSSSGSRIKTDLEDAKDEVPRRKLYM
ncbi:hypothetical protein L484_016086 [Morus notabilis]|uniref:Ubiquitin-like protease family profile domain-containing protein n=1 Tax=Morus notabilis TaxID=981085 RepID=W9S5M6_9ROSA|nr:hypothetical protein L484_016086 [Morus notabilis]